MTRMAKIVAQSLNETEHDILRNFAIYRKSFSREDIETLAQLRLIEINDDGETLSSLGCEVLHHLKPLR